MSGPATARSPEAQQFLDDWNNDPPKHDAARKTFNEYIQVLESLDAAGWDRFFALVDEDEQDRKATPCGNVMKFKAIARRRPADHAYCLYMRLSELDRPWWERHRRKIYAFVALPPVGTLVMWAAEHGGWFWDYVLRPLLGVVGFLGFVVGFTLLLEPGSLANLLRTAAAALERAAAALERERSVTPPEARSGTMSGAM